METGEVEVTLMDVLSEAEIQRRLSEIPEWKRDGRFISRRYAFKSFTEAIAFTNRVADVAERRNHHPFISIDYKMVTLRLTSWSAGGLTAADFGEAAELDEIYAEGGGGAGGGGTGADPGRR
ncbi:MAG: 4a-hydroxytetrahydrobiopterin dehydratase [Kyrpidia sp.]|nr:4a-hydroxytetrahydrobiopterin dehydratase [Kyrpidia sp.]